MLFGLDDLFETVAEDLALPVVIAGIGAAILAPVLLPVGKPLAKTAIKGGLILYEKSKTVFAEIGEAFEDIIAEAKAEISQSKTQKIHLLPAPAENEP
ncbi:MAG: DUF5132 domain-containing protein [Oscillatoriaceae bacterium SKW80]|nr:DUF5132 domain-containing protein [Oscillatoriaceae bacterium SKYG93]MCX8122261.1 DUF5132 domain-containing protein [Oscillatoriaceae bacterium SKW80]MDW8454547.1 DUF5132 domain-containing protein [Oscillatoriaceae cyanobacterium SKYGB_i_bin93]HIK29409.1 DUF5132 domain-containing protein [Oscillatoriaceae cyanobacterium M7585_C2015_266]